MNIEVSAATFKFTDTALYITYALVEASIIALLWSAIRNATFKKLGWQHPERHQKLMAVYGGHLLLDVDILLDGEYYG